MSMPPVTFGQTELPSPISISLWRDVAGANTVHVYIRTKALRMPSDMRRGQKADLSFEWTPPERKAFQLTLHNAVLMGAVPCYDDSPTIGLDFSFTSEDTTVTLISLPPERIQNPLRKEARD